ncbi:hypothetical protein SLEP1_g49291 [Rubroshorea leprosula]|uniref:Integrase catalytic domain-containing protein n=1 Tax=Rubroshorea leprosula TaxID=152421 RepID=A0AAV5LYE2_9ROSI|nr:hypothetical protein SLEP1_g49291 [Rubroshorea leprosula]
MERDCRAKQAQRTQQTQQPQYRPKQQQKANYVDEHAQQNYLFVASSSSSSTSASSWYIDSGCTSHMARDESIFLDLDKSVKTSVKLGNGTVVFSQGKGTTVIPTSSVKMVQNSFLLDMQSVQKCLHASKVNDTLLWHKRYGHFNVKALKYMQTNELIRDFPEVHVTNEVCQCCQLGKMHRLSFPINKAFRACEKLELVHTDICGPMKVPSLGQNKYFILFIDDFTRMTWVYFLSSKAQVFSVFKKFKALVENQSGCRIKKLRSNNGKEYTSVAFNNFCEEAGIQHQLTVSYTSQQNGVSERKNRTVMEMASSASSSMPSNTEIAEVDDDSPILKTKCLSEVYESCNLAISEPSSYEAAAKQDVWLQAMQEEIAMIEKNKTWYLTKKPQDKNVIGVKWVYRTKLNPNGSVHKYKARLVVKGYAQEPGVDYGETFALVARHDTIKLLVALAANLGWKLYHMDVKSAFLNGILEEEIYVEQPQGFDVAGKEDYVYRLGKALYGLKQAPRAWW